MKCGISRVRIKQTEEVEEALTREDIRGLIQKGEIWSVQKKGTSKFASKKKLEQKKKGRMRGPGRRPREMASRRATSANAAPSVPRSLRVVKPASTVASAAVAARSTRSSSISLST